jgi:hypothetical protein
MTMQQQGFLDNPTMHGSITIKNNEKENKVTTETIENKVIPYTTGVPSTEVGGFGIEGLESLDKGDVILPRKTILQPTSKKSDQPGYFYDNLTSQAVQAIDCVILNITHTRSLWSGDPADERPECASMDGVTGSRHGACSSCEFNPKNNPSLWEKGMKRCGPGYLILAVDRATDSMFIFSALKTSAKPVKPLITSFIQKRKPPFAFVTRLETMRQQNDLGKFYVLKPTVKDELSPSEIAHYRQMYLSMREATIKDIDDDIAAADADFDEDGQPF